MEITHQNHCFEIPNYYFPWHIHGENFVSLWKRELVWLTDKLKCGGQNKNVDYCTERDIHIPPPPSSWDLNLNVQPWFCKNLYVLLWWEGMSSHIIFPFWRNNVSLYNNQKKKVQMFHSKWKIGKHFLCKYC